MNYRHHYHVGSFADVFKHIVLVTLLLALQRKAKPFCYIETHAGAGRYDLNSKEIQKTREFASGIERLVQQDNFPPEVEAYLSTIKSVNPDLSSLQTLPHFYPGSPRIARNFLRLQDRMILAELHPEDARFLKEEFRGDRQVAIHAQDGYLALKAFLPPQERRGLVLIDPPYEQQDETARIETGLKMALERWETGIYAVWYPIKEKNLAQRLQHSLKKLNVKEILLAELSIYPEDSPLSLNGSGMAIINPPWQLDVHLKPLLAWLWQVLSPEKLGGFRIINLG